MVYQVHNEAHFYSRNFWKLKCLRICEEKQTLNAPLRNVLSNKHLRHVQQMGIWNESWVNHQNGHRHLCEVSWFSWFCDQVRFGVLRFALNSRFNDRVPNKIMSWCKRQCCDFHKMKSSKLIFIPSKTTINNSLYLGQKNARIQFLESEARRETSD